MGTAADLEHSVKFLLGFGCLLSWITLSRYIEANKTFGRFLKTLNRGLPGVSRFFLEAGVIFLGYALCGMVIFSVDTERVLNKKDISCLYFC